MEKQKRMSKWKWTFLILVVAVGVALLARCFISKPGDVDTIVIVYRAYTGDKELNKRIGRMITQNENISDALYLEWKNNLRKYTDVRKEITSPEEIDYFRNMIGPVVISLRKTLSGHPPIKMIGVDNGKEVWGVSVYENFALWNGTKLEIDLYDTILRRHPLPSKNGWTMKPE